MFSDVLLTVDFDRTLTAPDSTIPQRNLDAIHYFMDNGGTFTLNTGRSVPMSRHKIIGKVPVNAPLLLYNGSGAYDTVTGKLTQYTPLDVDPDALVQDLQNRFPDMLLEVQGLEGHHIFHEDPVWDRFNEVSHCDHWVVDQVPQPLIKLAIYSGIGDYGVPSMYEHHPEEQKRLQQVIDYVAEAYSDRLIVFRACPRLVDIHAKGCSKLQIARDLQKQLGKKILICVGDGDNDISMLEGADYAFCPADSILTDRFETVCNCTEGAVADVIYKKIPKILQIQP